MTDNRNIEGPAYEAYMAIVRGDLVAATPLDVALCRIDLIPSAINGSVSVEIPTGELRLLVASYRKLQKRLNDIYANDRAKTHEVNVLAESFGKLQVELEAQKDLIARLYCIITEHWGGDGCAVALQEAEELCGEELIKSRSLATQSKEVR